ANGGTAQVVYNFNPWLGFLGDFGGYHTGQIGRVWVNNNVANYLFGPRISFRKRKMVNPYMQTLIGGVWASESPFPNMAEQFRGSHSAFALLAGVGLDIRISRRVSFRPFEVDYFLTRFHDRILDNIQNQNNLRVSARISFLFGGDRP